MLNLSETALHLEVDFSLDARCCSVTRMFGGEGGGSCQYKHGTKCKPTAAQGGALGSIHIFTFTPKLKSLLPATGFLW